MRHGLLIVGDDLRINKDMLGYIYDTYEMYFGELGEIKFVSKSDKELLFVIENFIRDIDALCIFVSDESYDVMAKILATISSDVLELKDENTLATKNALSVCNGSFLIKLENSQVNLIRANPTEKISQILINLTTDFDFFNIFDVDKESAKIFLEPLAKPYKVQISLSEILPNLVLVRAEAEKFGSLNGFKQSVKNLFSNKMIDGRDIVKFIADKLIQNGLKITFAESCTAGMCAARFARYAGVSAVFNGSLVTYANEIKHEWLGVSDEILSEHGAVSEACVRAMLSGALRSSYSDFALAISGVAGPDGGSEIKPVGTVYVGAMSKDGEILVERLLLKGDRGYIREQSMLSAFVTLLKLKPELLFE